MSINSVTLGEITAIIVAFSLIGGCILFLYKLWNRFEQVERRSYNRQEDTAMIFECLRGCLEGLTQLKANGPVTESLNKLNRYTDNKAAGLTGDGKRR